MRWGRGALLAQRQPPSQRRYRAEVRLPRFVQAEFGEQRELEELEQNERESSRCCAIMGPI